jgi:hypothetical protein
MRFMLKLEGSVGHTWIVILWVGKLIMWLKVPFPKMSGSHMNCHFVSPETNKVIQSAIPQNELKSLYSNSWIAQGYVHKLQFWTLCLNLELKHIFVLWKERHCAKESKRMGGNLD